TRFLSAALEPPLQGRGARREEDGCRNAVGSSSTEQGEEPRPIVSSVVRLAAGILLCTLWRWLMSRHRSPTSVPVPMPQRPDRERRWFDGKGKQRRQTPGRRRGANLDA